MWYYLKGKEKVGPLSDALFQRYLNSKTISSDTLVWVKSSKKWLPAKVSPLYHDYAAEDAKYSMNLLRIATAKFRASLITLAALFVLLIYHNCEMIKHFENILENNYPSQIVEQIASYEYSARYYTICVMITLFGLLALRFAYKWIYTTSTTTTTFDREYKYTPSFSAYSIFLIIPNIFTPCKVAISLLKSSRRIIKQPPKIFDFILAIYWWIFVLTSAILFIIYILTFSTSSTTDVILPSIYFSICLDVITLIAILLSIWIVSLASMLQNKFYRAASKSN